MSKDKSTNLRSGLSGLAAGTVNGLFGGGGGMVLLPALNRWVGVEETRLFPTSVRVMLPVSGVSLLILGQRQPLPWAQGAPYLLGGIAGGIAAGLWGKNIPTAWLHRVLGAMMLWGGFRYLW